MDGKAAGLLEIIFTGEDGEAQLTAMAIASVVGPKPNWKVGIPRPYSEEDVIPQFRTPEMKKKRVQRYSFQRVGGLSDITVWFSPADAADHLPTPKADTAVDALWKGLIACGFRSVPATHPELPTGAIRIVVGPKM